MDQPKGNLDYRLGERDRLDDRLGERDRLDDRLGERDRLDDRLGKRDRLDVRLSARDGNTQRGSDRETEKEVSAMLEDYNLSLTDREDERSPPKLELASEFRRSLHSPPTHPPHTMDFSSVRFRPVMTSTYGHPRLELTEMGKVNKCVTNSKK